MAPTEKHVLEFFVEGLVYKEIADELGVSISTVATYVRRTYEKLHVRSRREVIARYRCPALVVHRGGQDG